MEKYNIATMTPLGSQVLLKLSPRKVQTTGGIVLPDNLKLSTWHSGIVVKIGPGKRSMKDGRRIPSQLKIGQKAVFRAFDESWQMLMGEDEQKYLLIPEESIEFCMNEQECKEQLES